MQLDLQQSQQQQQPWTPGVPPGSGMQPALQRAKCTVCDGASTTQCHCSAPEGISQVTAHTLGAALHCCCVIPLLLCAQVTFVAPVRILIWKNWARTEVHQTVDLSDSSNVRVNFRLMHSVRKPKCLLTNRTMSDTSGTSKAAVQAMQALQAPASASQRNGSSCTTKLLLVTT